ncbi:hypothetical protein NMG60_11031451 [Bertholletia excelsa]
MARTMLLLALCVLPALVSATRPLAEPFILEGKVYCDTCRLGYETSATTPIHGAKVRVVCKPRNSDKILYEKEATTDETGTYTMNVNEDHEDQICDAELLSSPQTDCATPDAGRDRARVILTKNNGICSNKRYANAMGFMRDHPMSGCKQVLTQLMKLGA